MYVIPFLLHSMYCTTSSFFTRSVQLFSLSYTPAPLFETIQAFRNYFPDCARPADLQLTNSFLLDVEVRVLCAKMIKLHSVVK